jgi:thiamine kinase-like enzyme
MMFLSKDNFVALGAVLFFLGRKAPSAFLQRNPCSKLYDTSAGNLVSSHNNNNNGTDSVYALLSLLHDNQNHKNDIIHPLTKMGFCNLVYEVQGVGIAKIFSPLAQARMQDSGFSVGEIDALFASHNLGPQILAASKTGILMERLTHSVLTESHMHQSDAKPILQAVARALAQAHALPVPDSCPNMLWHTLDAMLAMIPLDSARPYMDKVNYHKETLNSLNLKTVLGHGDFKPSNVILGDGTAIKFLDLEVSGRHYRAFDLAKFFRTSQRTEATESNQLYFLSVYLQEFGDKETTPDRLLHESQLLEPMTWLEAAIFFECSSHTDLTRCALWKQLAKDRMQNYERSLEAYKINVQNYVAEKRQVQQ